MFTKRLNQALKIQNLKPADLAHISGIDKGQISKYLHGKREPKAETITILAQALGVSADFLLGISDDPTPAIGESNLSPQERDIVSALRQGDVTRAATLVLTKAG